VSAKMGLSPLPPLVPLPAASLNHVLGRIAHNPLEWLPTGGDIAFCPGRSSNCDIGRLRDSSFSPSPIASVRRHATFSTTGQPRETRWFRGVGLEKGCLAKAPFSRDRYQVVVARNRDVVGRSHYYFASDGPQPPHLAIGGVCRDVRTGVDGNLLGCLIPPASRRAGTGGML
jgi:hypothetical protein